MLRRTLRHYGIVEHLGSGGMGDVYRARDTKLDRDVTIELLQLGMTREEQGAVDEALGLMRDRSGFNFDANWESGDGEMYYELASYSALAGSKATALEHLERAVACGWRELPRLEGDQAFDPLRGSLEYQKIAKELEAIPPLP
jgi:serine/threonine protein kinase